MPGEVLIKGKRPIFLTNRSKNNDIILKIRKVCFVGIAATYNIFHKPVMVVI
jgi:hypothetical protein